MRKLPAGLDAFLDAHDWETSRRVLAAHPELLTDAVDSVLDQMAEFYQVALSKKGRTTERVREHQELLRRCRQVGVEAAFAGKRGRKTQTVEALLCAFVLAPSLDEAQVLAEQFPQLLDEGLDERIDEVVGASLAESDTQTEERRRLLRRCREVGVEQAFAEHRAAGDLLETLVTFLNTNELSQSRRFVEDHPELLTSEAAAVLADFVDGLADPEHAAVARELQSVLAQCREVGIEAAYARHRVRLIERALERISASGARRDSAQQARLQKDLGSALMASGSAADTLRAVGVLEQALRVAPPAQSARDYAHVHVLLARACRATGGPEGAGRAGQLLLEARDLIRRDDDPDLWGEVHFQLGVYYTSLPQGRDSDRQEENQYTAIRCFQEALRVCDQASRPAAHATLRRWLGDAFGRMPRDSDDEARHHLGQAIRCYDLALAGPLPPPERVRALEGLAHTHAAWPEEDRAQHRERAIECCRAALPLLGSARLEAREALLRFLLGLLCKEQGGLGDPRALDEAEEQLAAARKLVDRERQPDLSAAIATALGNHQFQRQRWEAAETAYLDGLSATAPDAEGPDGAAAGTSELRRNLAFCQARRGAALTALESLEQGRALGIRRSLLQQLVLADAPDASQSWFHAALTRLRAAHEQLRQERPAGGARMFTAGPGHWLGAITVYEHKDPVGSKASEAARTHAEAVTEYQGARRTFASVLRDLAAEVPALATTGWSPDDIGRLTQDRATAVIVPVVTRQGSVALIAQRDGVRAMQLPGLSEDTLATLAGWGPLPVFGSELRPAPRPGQGGYLGAYFDRQQHFERWLKVLDETLRALGELFWGPLLRELAGEVTRLVLVPQGRLWLFPLHAAWIDGPAPGTRRYVLDRYEVSYAPSLGVARVCGEMARRGERSLFAVINPQEDPALRWTWVEGESLRRLFPSALVQQGRAATRTAVLEAGVRHACVHVASHGRFHWLDVEQSGLRLADGWLTMHDILSGRWDLRGVQLVTLSACETGISDVDLVSQEEFVSLPGALLLAGVRSVVGTLWTVEDMATALIVRRMYANLEREMSVAGALREAQTWLRDADQASLTSIADDLLHGCDQGDGPRPLRDLGASGVLRSEGWERPFGHPFYWAGLTCVGG